MSIVTTEALATRPSLRLEFCDEWRDVPSDRPFSIGRDTDYVIDDNPYLHRRFLELSWHDGFWWLANVGNQLAATLSDDDARVQAWLAPGTHLPVVFPKVVIRFAAGPTSYELNLHLGDSPFSLNITETPQEGTTTIGRVVLTPDQRLLIVALAEPALLLHGLRGVSLPSSTEAAARLGWPITKFNRKLDNVCHKLKKSGVRGLHGDAENLASGRRARLVEYALATRLVTVEDLDLLNQAH